MEHRTFITLNALGYALDQCYDSWISILYRRSDESPALHFSELKELALEVAMTVEEEELTDEQIATIRGLNTDLVSAILKANTLEDLD